MAKDTVRKKTKVAGDPLDLNGRLYSQLGKLLDDMESADAADLMTMPQRISALIAVARVQKMFQDLRKGEFNAGAGSAVAKYAAAFATTNATSGRNFNTGRPPDTLEIDSSDDDADFDTAA